MKLTSLSKLHPLLFWLFLLLLPTQLSKHFWPQFSIVSGLPVDYLSPAIYFTDILLLATLLVWKINDSKKIVINKPQVIIIALSAVNIIFSLSPISSFIHWLRMLEAYLLFVYVKENVTNLHKLIRPLFIGSLLILFLSITQIMTGNNVGALFTLFGERPLNINSPGIALMEISGQSYLRPYATFPHPNAMAGYAGLLMLFILNVSKSIKNKHIILKIFSTVCFVLVVISFSQAALIALLVSLCMLLFQTKFGAKQLIVTLSLLFIGILLVPTSLTSDASISQRLLLNEIGISVFTSYPIFGVGLGQFLRLIPEYTNTHVWWIQPIHNLPLLFIVETGIVGIVSVFMLIKKLNINQITNHQPLIVFIILTSLVDHYWLTSHQNLLLLAVIAGVIFSKKIVTMNTITK